MERVGAEDMVGEGSFRRVDMLYNRNRFVISSADSQISCTFLCVYSAGFIGLESNCGWKMLKRALIAQFICFYPPPRIYTSQPASAFCINLPLSWLLSAAASAGLAADS